MYCLQFVGCWIDNISRVLLGNIMWVGLGDMGVLLWYYWMLSGGLLDVLQLMVKFVEVGFIGIRWEFVIFVLFGFEIYLIV